jgi:hypothetical protein
MTEGSHRASPAPALSNRSYDILKNVVTLALPAAATLYVALAALWNLPHAEAVLGSITALATFLGVFLKIVSNSYANQPVEYDGNLTLTNVNGTEAPEMMLTLNSDEAINEIPQKDQVTFKVLLR